MYKCCARIVSDDRCIFCTYIVHLFPRCCCKNWRWIHETAYWSLIDQMCTFLLKIYSHRKIFKEILNIDIGIISCSFLFSLPDLEKNICRNIYMCNFTSIFDTKEYRKRVFNIYVYFSLFFLMHTRTYIYLKSCFITFLRNFRCRNWYFFQYQMLFDSSAVNLKYACSLK